MRISYTIQGVIFVPAFVGLVFVLKAFCPATAGSMCFADYFATPIFLPLIAVYKIFGGTPASIGQELLFIILYWAVVGFLVGLMMDLLLRKGTKETQSEAVYAPPQMVSTRPTSPRTQSSESGSTAFYSSQTPLPKPPINLLDIKEKPPL